MLTPPERATLDRLLEALLPVGTAQAEVSAYVQERADAEPEPFRAALILVEAHGFSDLTDLVGHPAVARVLRYAVEGYATSVTGMAEMGFRVTA